MKIFKLFFIFFFFVGCTKEVEMYYLDQIKQKPLYIPFWIFGFHVWEDINNNSKSVNYLVDNYTNNNINISSIIFDSPWATSYNNFIIDTNRYINLSILLNKLEKQKLKKIFWLTGYQNTISSDALNSRSNLYDIYKINNYFVNNNSLYSWW